MDETKRILIVGGAGYLGSHVTRYLASQARVTVYDSLLYRDEFLEPAVDFVYGDICDDLLPLIKYAQADRIIWLAAIVGDPACNTNPAIAHMVNVEAVERVAQKFHGPLIFISTASVYGYSDEIVTEDSPLNPQSFYAETKVKAEQALAGRENTLILRLATLHGVSPRMRFDLGVNAMTRDAVMKGVVTIHSGGQWRPWASVRDVAHFIRCQAVEDPMSAGVYNIVSENTSVNQVANAVCVITGAQRRTLEIAIEDQRDYRMDGNKIGGRYQPVITIEDSVVEIARLLEERRLRDPYASKYINSKVIQGLIVGGDYAN